MGFYLSLILVTGLLLAGTRETGVLLGGTIFTYQLSSVSHLPWLGTAYVVAATLISVTRFLNKPHKVELQPTDWGVLAVVLLSVLSIYWSYDPQSGEPLALCLSVAGMYGIARLLPLDQGKSIRAMIWTMALVSPFMSLLLLNERASDGWQAQTRLLIEGSEASAVGLSQPFAPCLLACSILLLMRMSAWRKGAIVGGLAVVTYAAIASGTRSVFLAYGAGLIAFVLLNLKTIKPSRLLQGVLAMVIASSILMFFAPIDSISQSATRFLGIFGKLGDDASSLERFDAYATAWEQFLQHPLQGIGDGGLIHFAKFPYPHNIFLEILSEFGAIGVLVFGFWFGSLFREAVYLRSRDAETGAILIALFVVVFTQHQVSFSIAMGRTLFLASALLTAYGSGLRLDARKRIRRPGIRLSVATAGPVVAPKRLIT